MLQSGSEIIENISWRQDSDNTVMAPMAVPSSGSVPLGVPVSNHEYDLTDADTFNKKGFYSIGANPPPAWSQREYSAGSLETGIQLIIISNISYMYKIHNQQFCYYLLHYICHMIC